MNKEKFMKNGVFSLEYDKETLKDMVLELQDKLEAYENMRKEIIKIINREKNDDGDLYLDEFEVSDLLNILNKVGGSDE
jgi:hypothetical protein